MTTTHQYSDKLLKARVYNQFITVPQTTINYTKLHQAFIDYANCTYAITKLEQHEDMGLHIHLVVKFKSQVSIQTIHKIITSQEGTITGLIDYQKPKNINQAINYCKKEDTAVEDCPWLEHGEIPKNHGRPTDDNEAMLTAIEQAQEGDIEGAMQTMKERHTRDYLLYKNQIKNTLQEETKKYKKYTPISFHKEDVKLSKSQQQVWDLLQETPKTRRIIWVTGQYGVGKSYLFNYITANHEYGTYNAGQCASMDRVAYGYNEEGVIAWDLPRNFDFTTLGDPLASVIEKFSDFSQYITSKMYNGKTQRVLGHAIVFSNHPPLDSLGHRDIIHINLERDEPEQEPEQEPQHEQVQNPVIPVNTVYTQAPEEYEDLRADKGPKTPFIKDKKPIFNYPDDNNQNTRIVKARICDIIKETAGQFITLEHIKNESIIKRHDTKQEAQNYIDRIKKVIKESKS